jgi:hypothetical protein
MAETASTETATPPTDSPKIPGKEPIFRSLDDPDMQWQQVKRQRNPHVVYVISGEVWIGDRYCPAGTHIELPYGAAFGPIRAGAEGCVMFEVMLGDPRSWGDEPETLVHAREEHGVTPLPDVDLDYPEWLQDLRSHWTAGQSAPQ